MINALNWFEIPVAEMARAVEFYSTIFEMSLVADPASEGYQMAAFPSEGVSGALLHGEGYIPSMEGTVIYLNGGDDLAPILARIEPAGGKILVPKTNIGEHGFFAFFLDSEGNKIGLHSMH